MRYLIATVLAATVVATIWIWARDDRPPPPDESRPNVLLFLIDTLRTDRLSGYGYPHATTPNIDALMARAVVFTNAYSTTNRTTPAIASLLTGLHVGRHGYVGLGYDFQLDERFLTLPELFSANGYITGAVSASVAFSRRFGVAQGFDAFEESFLYGEQRVEWRGSEVARVYRDGAEVTDAAVRWLEDNRDRPFFLIVHYFDPHSPDERRDAAESSFPEPYDDDVAYTDSQVAAVVNELEELGLDENTIIIFTADHGENLEDEDRSYRGHEDVLQNTVRIPLFFAARQLEPALLAQNVQLVDLFPTLAAWLPRGERPPYRLDGLDLNPLLRASSATGRQAFDQRPLFFRESYEHGDTANVAVISGNWKAVAPFRLEQRLPARTQKHKREEALFDLAKDPRAQVNLRAAAPQVFDALRTELREWLELQTAEYPAASDHGEPPADRMDALRALGYLQ